MSEAPYTLVATDGQALVNQTPIDAERLTVQQVFRGDGASMMRLAFQAGQVVREHSAPRPILVQVLEGHITFSIGDEAFDMPQGAIVHVDARVLHEVTALEDSHLLLILCG